MVSGSLSKILLLPSQSDITRYHIFGSKVWNMVSLEIKKLSKYSTQKLKIGSLKIVTVCYLCKTYINNLHLSILTKMSCFTAKKLFLRLYSTS